MSSKKRIEKIPFLFEYFDIDVDLIKKYNAELTKHFGNFTDTEKDCIFSTTKKTKPPPPVGETKRGFVCFDINLVALLSIFYFRKFIK